MYEGCLREVKLKYRSTIFNIKVFFFFCIDRPKPVPVQDSWDIQVAGYSTEKEGVLGSLGHQYSRQ